MEANVTTPLSYCLERSESSGSNFLLAFRLLPKRRRHALYAFYAFCREVDDVADDESLSVETRKEALLGWRAEVEACYNGKPNYLALQELCKYVKDYAIPKEDLLEIISGVEMDLYKTRYATFEELYTYCYRVASVVGMVCSRIFGCKTKESLRYAELLGIAFQLTNIIRDVGNDLERQRIYLPGADIKKFGYSEEEFLDKNYNDAFRQLIRFEQDRAMDYYRQAKDALPATDYSALLPARLMASYYQMILRKSMRRQVNLFNERITISKSYKVLMLALYFPQVLIAKCRNALS